MKEQMYDAMYQMNRYHWWFRAKRDIAKSLADSHLPSPTANKLIDFGCGCGMMLETLASYGTVTGTDFSPLALDYCRKRFSGELRQLDLFIPATPWAAYDLGVALDILEHIEDDSSAVDNIFQLLRPGGICIITVPAYPWPWSPHDENCMHKRRYTSKNLQTLLIRAGFEIEYISYYNTLLFPPAALVRLLSNGLLIPCFKMYVVADKMSATLSDLQSSK